MRMRIVGLLAAAVMAALLMGCDGSSSDKASPSSPPATAAQASQPVVLDTTTALQNALKTAGISDARPVRGKGDIVVWAAVPGFKPCLVRFEAVPQGGYTATRIRLTNGNIQPLEGLPSQPVPADFTQWGLQNAGIMLGCKGNTPPPDKDWPAS